LTRAEGRKFGLSVGLAFCALAALVWWRGHLPLARGFGGVGILLVLSGVLIPGRLDLVHRIWMGLAHAISKVTTPIFMSLVYFVTIMPMGFLRRNIGRHPLRHKAHDDSYWVTRSSESTSSLERQF
jgi:hypothetical protein